MIKLYAQSNNTYLKENIVTSRKNSSFKRNFNYYERLNQNDLMRKANEISRNEEEYGHFYYYRITEDYIRPVRLSCSRLYL